MWNRCFVWELFWNYFGESYNFCVISGGKYEPYLSDNAYKIHMKLTIKAMGKSDFGVYKCVSKNSLGDTDGTIKVYREYLLFILFR